MPRKPKEALTKRRQAELKRQYRTGKDIGKAIIKFFVEEMKNPDENIYQPAQTTLTAEEIHFLESTIEDSGPNREEFTRYYNYYHVINGQEYWINYYTQRYYRGFFKVLSILQDAGYDLEHLTLLESLLPKDDRESKKLISNAREKYSFSLKAISDMLVKNVKVHLLFAFGNLYLYSVMMKEIEDNWKLGVEDIIPNMEVCESEFLQLQELSKTLKKNIENHEGSENIKEAKEAISALQFLCNLTLEKMRPSEEVQEIHRNKITELMNFRLDMILSSSFDTNKYSLSI